MSSRLSRRRLWLGVAALLLSGLQMVSLQAAGRPRGRSINEFPVPTGNEVTTNLNQLTSKKDGLKQLEEEIYRPFQSFKSSLDGVVARPPRAPAAPTIQNKRVKDLLERRKDWVFLTPEDLLAVPTVDEILKAPQLESDREGQKDLPAVERFYQRLAAKRPEASNPLQNRGSDLLFPAAESKPGEESALREEMNLPSSLRESAEALNRLFDPTSSDSPFARAATHGDFSDIFGLEQEPPSPQQAQERKKAMDEYRALVDPSWRPLPAATAGSAFAVYADAAASAAKPAAGAPGPASSAPRSALDAQFDVVSPQLGPAALPDVNAQALGQTRPTPPLPKFDATRVAPPAPAFAAPKRSFR